jgi:hypothetical protein
LKDAAGLLDRYAESPHRQLDRLLAVATFTVLIGNTDALGKNVALLHPTAETVELAPLYDTVPTVLWPKLRTSAAMSVNGRSELETITPEDLLDHTRRSLAVMAPAGRLGEADRERAARRGSRSSPQTRRLPRTCADAQERLLSSG